MQTGLDKIVREAKSFHFSTPMNPYPSLALGAFETIPLELARAYCVFAADGVEPYPLSLKNVQSGSRAILNRRHMQIERLISPAKAFIISSMLRSAVVEGTAKSLKNYGISFPTAGKTGTTSNFRDAWFIGYTPDILALVWVGFDNGDSVHATGSGAALPIWADLMRSIPQHLSGTWFQIPPGIVKRKICPESGLLPRAFACPVKQEEVFLEENVPNSKCTVHKVRIFDNIMEGIKSLAQ
jgi:penicillin-binding protein 1B